MRSMVFTQPDAAPKNDILLGKAFRQADSFAVPTIIAGDFNCAFSDLHSWHSAVARGFVDVAQRVALLHDQVPEPTYKGICRLDYVVCNPIAATAFQDFMLDPMQSSQQYSIGIDANARPPLGLSLEILRMRKKHWRRSVLSTPMQPCSNFFSRPLNRMMWIRLSVCSVKVLRIRLSERTNRFAIVLCQELT